MGAFLRYLASLAIHLAWQRTGNRGAVPPIRLPKKGPVQLPAIAPWQMMIAMWVLQKVWAAYGDDVKGRLVNHKNKLVKQVGSSLPGTPGLATTEPDSAVVTARPAPSLATQPLPADPAKKGSVLSRLRGSTASG